MNIIGKKLETLEYMESQNKPNLFYKKINEKVIFADLRGTEVIPIWDDWRPMIYSKDLSNKDDFPCVPCCFKSWDSPAQKERREQCINNKVVEKEVDDQDDYIKGSDIGINTWFYSIRISNMPDRCKACIPRFHTKAGRGGRKSLLKLLLII